MARLSLTFLRFSLPVALALVLSLLGGGASPVHAAPFTVTKTADTNDGACDSDCSLREAIIAANGVGGPEITLPAGTYTLTRVGEDDTAANGDLDITDNVTITGAGAGTTIIDGNGGVTGDRVFHLDPSRTGTVAVEMSGVTVRNGSKGVGGGIWNNDYLLLSDSVVTGNIVSGVGGGLYNDPGAGMTLSNVKVSGNIAAADGGGIWSDGGLSVFDSTISGNTASTGAGGGIYNQTSGNLTVEYSTISGNSASAGGGIRNESSSAGVKNSTISGNSASSGGGVDNRGTLTVRETTIAANTASSGGGIYAFNVTLQSTIIANNPSGLDCFITTGPPGTTSSYSLDSDGTCGLSGVGDQQNKNPKLGPLADNGGPTKTYALLPGSPAIDAGTNAVCTTIDQRGVARPADGDLNGTATCDIGAYERENKTDVTQYRSSNSTWYVRGLANVKWGLSGDTPVPADYNNNGKANIAMYRPSDRKWYVRGQPPVQWGLPGDVPVPGDYDGDDKANIAMYRPSDRKWYVPGMAPVQWGQPGDIPVPADYDNDGTTEIAQYRPSNRTWYVRGMAPVQWGLTGDIPVPADYNGDGKTQIGQYRSSNGTWYVPGMAKVSWGLSGDMPLPGDYNGNGKANMAVWRPSDGVWYVRGSSNVHWGKPGDAPVPKDYY